MSYIKYNNKWINEFFSTGDAPVSGTTTETITSAIVIPANTYKEGDFIELESMFNKVGTNSAYTIRYYSISGNTPILSGVEKQLGVRSIGATNRFATLNRRLYIRTANGTGSGLNLGTELASVTSGIFDDYEYTTVSNVAIDWTNDVTIFSTIQNSSTLDSTTQHYLKIWEW